MQHMNRGNVGSSLSRAVRLGILPGQVPGNLPMRGCALVAFALLRIPHGRIIASASGVATTCAKQHSWPTAVTLEATCCLWLVHRAAAEQLDNSVPNCCHICILAFRPCLHTIQHQRRCNDMQNSGVVAILVQVLGQRVAFHICVLAGQLSNNSTIGGQAEVTFAVLRLP